MKTTLIILYLLLAQNAFSQTCGEVSVTGIIDGDTFRAEMQGIPRPLNRVSIRLKGIDTPEIRGKCENEKALARRARAFSWNMLVKSSKIELKNQSWDKYGGRILADVIIDDKSLADLLIKENLGVPYHGEKKTKDWCLVP
jgi:endonuclease YncB( thermonuclease family)